MEADFQDTLHAALATFASDNAFPVKWEGYEVEGEPDLYLAPAILPVTPEQLLVKGVGAKHVWLYQVSFYVRKGQPLDLARAALDLLIADWPIETRFAGSSRTFQVERPAKVIPPVPSDGWTFIPVQFRLSTIS